MQVSKVTSAAALMGSADDPASRVPQKTLGQADFLNLLVTQLANQDPMNPMSDTDFIAQMASFTSLQQTKETQASIQSLQANNLIGRLVVMQGADGSINSGVVSQVLMDSGTPNLLVNGQTYTLDQLQSVSPAPTSTSTQGASS